MRVLVTGSAGFIGSALTLRLLERGDEVIGLDNHNDYYDPQLKEDRLARHAEHERYSHVRGDLHNGPLVDELFQRHQPEQVVNLAAQAGVRYSLENPLAYVDSNLVGFVHLLEACRQHRVSHLVYASSSSVYGGNTKLPFSVHDRVDHPVSLYAAVKRANELIAHTYSHLNGLPTTGLRFFTVYGPWDRPDMALQKFTRAILSGEPIRLYNRGNHRRDFTYIDDIVEGVIRVLDRPARPDPDWQSDRPDSASSSAPWRIYNIGSNRPVELNRYIEALEQSLGRTAEKELLPLQPGDVVDTFADVDELVRETGYKPDTPLSVGIQRFVDWYLDYY